MSLHEQCVGKTDEWYTPAYVFEAMNVRFDLDVAFPSRSIGAPLVPARDWCRLVLCGRGLEFTWGSKNFVWMNPPFGGRNAIEPWLAKFMAHGDGVALTPDRTSCPWWQTYSRLADAVLFVDGKIRFIGADGKTGNSPAQGTTLFAKGPEGVVALLTAERRGLGVVMRRVEATRATSDSSSGPGIANNTSSSPHPKEL